MLGFRGPDKGIVRDVQAFPKLLKLRGEFVAVRLRIDAGLRRGLLDFLAMLIETGEEKDIASSKAPVASQYISGDGGVGMADMRHVVDVIDRSCDVELVLIAHSSASKDNRLETAKARLEPLKL